MKEVALLLLILLMKEQPPVFKGTAVIQPSDRKANTIDKGKLAATQGHFGCDTFHS